MKDLNKMKRESGWLASHSVSLDLGILGFAFVLGIASYLGVEIKADAVSVVLLALIFIFTALLFVIARLRELRDKEE